MVVFAACAVGGSLLLAPMFMLFISIIFMASLGKSLGVRRFYVALLLKVFEYGRQNIESAKNQTRINFELSGSSESGSSGDSGAGTNKVTQSAPCTPATAGSSSSSAACADETTAGAAKATLPNGRPHHQHTYSNGGNTVITRDALILLPEGGDLNGVEHHHSNHNHQLHKSEASALAQSASASAAANTTTTTPAAGAAAAAAATATASSASETGPVASASESNEAHHFEFDLANCLDYVKTGMEAIIEDDVTSRFEAEELKNWNLLTRTNRYYEFISWRLSVIWVCGFVVRYAVLMPVRILTCFLGVLWLTFCTACVGCIPDGETKRWLVQKVLIQCFGLLSSALSSVVNYHNMENRPGASGICVANHTSPIDVLMLMQDNCYSLIGQSHGGFLGVLQRALARASPHIWFERAESKDRLAVAQRLRSHVSDPRNPPILIFPEGTCINNTSVMQFKKGSFEVGGVIYPVAIKYDPRFGDPFWNSSKYSMMQHLLLMMTSWAIVCDVWYLPPMYRQDDEPAIVFANRVKSVIAEQGGLIDLVWDGNLKRNKPKEEWKEKQQEEFTKRLKAD